MNNDKKWLSNLVCMATILNKMLETKITKHKSKLSTTGRWTVEEQLQAILMLLK